MTTPKNTERPNIPCAWVDTHELPRDNIVRLTLSLVLDERRTVRAIALRFLADLEAASPPESSWFIAGPTHVGVARRRSVWTIEMHLAGLDYWTDARAVACKVCHDFNAAHDPTMLKCCEWHASGGPPESSCGGDTMMLPAYSRIMAANGGL